ncbi:hypothetical protein PA3448_05293 [Pseudomonas aeruginosa]|nr:hypothetical protein M062_05265 [Pseudomonas aeruginosa RP73]AOX29117.1 hypothetical protein PA1088_05000 [Pseudomonas aeruginosa]KAJ11095.1 hypothetical protein M002_19460 [Pseudomonas aeruginosa ID4365]APB59696.1 hypothetical protein PA7790_04415 [Pseudomonas aeruginosa]OGX63771.1 hypothetical protein PA3448_05293 [Pseudomonas aeruginosa]
MRKYGSGLLLEPGRVHGAKLRCVNSGEHSRFAMLLSTSLCCFRKCLATSRLVVVGLPPVISTLTSVEGWVVEWDTALPLGLLTLLMLFLRW